MIYTVNPDVIAKMNWQGCAIAVASVGALGGAFNAYFADHGFKRPTVMNGIWCPGAIGNVAVGAISAIVSWALYGSGAGVDIALANANAPEAISLRLSALAGALVVGIAGARWLSSAVDKALLDESVREVARKVLSPEQKEELQSCDTPRKVLKAVAKV